MGFLARIQEEQAVMSSMVSLERCGLLIVIVIAIAILAIQVRLLELSDIRFT